MKRPPIYGLLAEFTTPGAAVAAAQRVHAAGYTKVDAYSPYAIEALSEALGHHRSPLPKVVLAGGLVGLAGSYALQYWSSVIEYPLNIGGKPFHAWPAFLIPTFETTILGAALAAVFGMLALNGLPHPYHPVFNVEEFALATRDRFFLCVEARDPRFDRTATRRFLEELGARGVSEVEH